jgi:hypothetical protein
MRGDDTTASLAMVESGARWPAVAEELQRRTAHIVVEAQAAGESAEEFAFRVARRLRILALNGIGLEIAVLAVGDEVNLSLLSSREELARAALGAMLATGGGELIIVADEEADGDVRHELFALAGRLIDELAGQPVGVRVRFAGLTRSGVRRIRRLEPALVIDTA